MSTAPSMDPAESATGAIGLAPTPPSVDGDMLYEMVDGQVVEKSMGAFEASIATILVEILGPFVRTNRLGQVFGELLFRIDQKKDLQRRPDVAFVGHAKWPWNRRAPRVAVWDMVPDLAIEVVSESNSAFQVQKKIHEYFDASVSGVWAIYPEQEEVHLYSARREVKIIGPGEDLDGGTLLPGFRLPVATLFEDDPE